MIAQLIALHGINEQSHRHAADIWSMVEPETPRMAASFYDRLRAFDQAAHLADERATALEQQMCGHWKILFTGRFCDSYIQCASMVGIKHREVGVDATWCVAAYGLLKQDLAQSLLRHDLSNDRMAILQGTLDRYVCIDMTLILSTYSAWLID